MRVLWATGDEREPVVFGEDHEPVPAPDEAIVEVEAFSINRGETFLLANPRPGRRPGKDVAGLVVQAAADGSGPAVGTRVVGHPEGSGWAERVAVPTGSLAVLPDSVTSVQAAALPLAGLTAVRLLRRAALSPGDRVLITGASGGVGHYFVELAAAAGVEVTAVTAGPARGERLLERGASAVVHDPAAAAGPFDVVLESVGDESFPAALQQLRPGGKLIWFGMVSRTAPRIAFFDFFKGPNQATIEHFDYTRSDRGYDRDLATLVRLVATGRLHPEIGLTEDWADTAKAVRALRERTVRGKAVLTVSR